MFISTPVIILILCFLLAPQLTLGLLLGCFDVIVSMLGSVLSMVVWCITAPFRLIGAILDPYPRGVK